MQTDTADPVLDLVEHTCDGCGRHIRAGFNSPDGFYCPGCWTDLLSQGRKIVGPQTIVIFRDSETDREVSDW